MAGEGAMLAEDVSSGQRGRDVQAARQEAMPVLREVVLA
jgi:hypothetical protein